MNGIRVSSVALAVVVGYLIPLLFVNWLVFSFFGGVSASERGTSNTLPWLLLHVGGPVLGGYAAAKLAPARPKAHALLAAAVGWLLGAWFLGSGIVAAITYAAASIVGTFIRAKTSA